MALLPDIVYNANEGSATLIRDYSDGTNGDATGVNLTNQLSVGEVGNELVFNGTTSEMSTINTIAFLSAVTGFTIYMRIKFDSNTGTDTIFEIDGIINLTWDGTTLQSELIDSAASTITITNDITAISTGVYLNIAIRLNDATNNYRMIIGTTNQTAVNTSGTTATITDTLDFGFDGAGAYSAFSLNEFKLYSVTLAAIVLQAFTLELNGVFNRGTLDGEFQPGDIVAALLGSSSPVFAIISFVDSTNADFRILPISDNVRNGIQVSRVGHLWDTTRQESLFIDDGPEITFFDGVSQTSEVNTDAKRITYIDKNGIFEQGRVITSSYNVLDNDRFFDLDLSVAAITATLPATIVPNKLYSWKDDGNSNGVRRLTIDGNGNNIDGVASFVAINFPFESVTIRGSEDGTQWFIIY